MKKKALVIGYGSIGKKHAQLLKKSKSISEVVVMTSQKNISFKKIKNINEIKKINPFYIVIASATKEHYSQLKFIENNFSNKKILVEKPLFHKNLKLNIKKNKVYVGYNLRFSKMLNYIRAKILNKKIIYCNSYCGYYLPNWRKNRHYSKSYSSKKSEGGGVLMDLSHEIDYLQWLFGKIKIINSVNKKISKLKIDTDDFFSLNAYSKNSKLIQLNTNYISKKKIRTINIETNNFGIYGDLISNKLEIIYKKKKKLMKWKEDKNFLETYSNQHESIIQNKNLNKLCSYNDGLKVLKFIDQIKKIN